MDLWTFSSLTDTMVGGDEIQEDTTQGEVMDTSPGEVKETKPDVKEEKPDVIRYILEKVIDTILMEEVCHVGMKMNRYKAILAKAILDYADGHQEEDCNLDLLVDSFRAGWKVYREKEDEKAAVKSFMKEMNNQFWIEKEGEPAEKKARRRKKPAEGSKISCCTVVQ